MRVIIGLLLLVALPAGAASPKPQPPPGPHCDELLPIKEIEATCKTKVRPPKKGGMGEEMRGRLRCSQQLTEAKGGAIATDVTIYWDEFSDAPDLARRLDGEKDLPNNVDFESIDGLGDHAVRFTSEAPKYRMAFPTVEFAKGQWVVKLVSGQSGSVAAPCTAEELLELARLVEKRIKR